ncbi:polyprenol phosphomannose-dependent alpha 1,6 mannosyltransferase MptB [Gordonia sp. TBRC 11910]|uniref:Polyprenol phosphomannose-dependent alpha 1,6 mannosyltransferase MptB n=1 Tax=Gordonia asplenii TaxID=2725283 RepID=A0A848KYW2_9ACTN|nr:polyprenol phosphomannose-dependent alpha 1,6 mannosyltransferase MptB [Gordonia asplenii]NMO03337.1 polyprenol phosphomannose-dependent alpha 1,6 mannosyltransferase MptB [Gordonia asplenii]
MTDTPDTARAPRELWWGALASGPVAIGAFGVADIPRASHAAQWGFLATMTYGHGKTLSAILFWTGVATMVFCWMRVGRRLLAGDDQSRSAVPPTLRHMRLAALGWAAPLMVTVPIYSRDVYAYLAQAAVFRAGFNPYTDGPVHYPGPLLDSMAQVWAATTAPYGPAFVALMRGVVQLTGDHVILGVLVVRLVLLPGLLLSLWAIPRLARHFGASPQTGLWLAILNPLILIHVVGGPHVELLMMGVLVAGVTLVVTRRHLTGLVVLGLAVSIKITAGVAIPFVVWIWLAHLRDDRAQSDPDASAVALWRLGWRPVVGVFAATVLIPVAVFAFWTTVTGLGMGWLNGLSWADRIINWLTVPTLVGHVVTWVAAPFVALNLQPVLGVTRLIGEAALALILVWMWWRGRGGERIAMTSLLWAMFAVLLLEPSSLPWYYTWVLVLAAAVTLPNSARAWIIGAAVVGLIVFQPDDSIVLYKPVELLLAFTLGALAGWSLRHPDPLRLGSAARWVWSDSASRPTDVADADAAPVR